MKSAAAFAVILAVTLGVGWLGSGFTATSVATWYPTLAKPPLTPPDWVFAPVWTALYVLMALAAWLVWRDAGGRPPLGAASLYLAQLLFNLSWSIVFFGLRMPVVALGVVLILLFAIALTMRSFARVDRRAAWLLAPYLAWTAFATYLNAGIVYRNVVV